MPQRGPNISTVRAYLSKPAWKKFIIYLGRALRKPCNSICLVDAGPDDSEWNSWFHQFFHGDLQKRFWACTGNDKRRFQHNRDAIIRTVLARCKSTARSIRNENRVSRPEPTDISDDSSHTDLQQTQPENPQFKSTIYEELELDHGDSLHSGHEAAGETSGGTASGESAPRKDPDNTFATNAGIYHSPPKPYHGRGSDIGGLHQAMSPGKHGPSSRKPVDETAPWSGVTSSNTALPVDPFYQHSIPFPLSRQFRRQHSFHIPTKLPSLYAWAIAITSSLPCANPVRQIYYKREIPSLRDFVAEIKAIHQIPDQVTIRGLAACAGGDAFRVMVGTNQAKMDWYYVASRMFEVGTLVDIDVWIK